MSPKYALPKIQPSYLRSLDVRNFKQTCVRVMGAVTTCVRVIGAAATLVQTICL